MTKNTRGGAWIPVLIILTLVSGYFAVPRVVADLKMRHATKEVATTAKDQQKAGDDQRSAEVNTGRAIQREATQAASALSLLPSNPQLTFATDRLTNIGFLSNQLYGPAPAQDVAKWQKLAFDAFAEAKAVRQAAEKELAAQQATINDTITKLDAAQKAKETADARAQRAVAQLVTTQHQLDEANGLAAMLKFILTWLAILALAALAVSMLATHFPAFAPAATALHTIFAPGAALLLKKAKDEGNVALTKAGEFFGRVRGELPEVAAKIRALGDEVFDGSHKGVIGTVANKVHADIAAAREEARNLLAATK